MSVDSFDEEALFSEVPEGPKCDGCDWEQEISVGVGMEYPGSGLALPPVGEGSAFTLQDER
jgi:hypothetical protein